MRSFEALSLADVSGHFSALPNILGGLFYLFSPAVVCFAAVVEPEAGVAIFKDEARLIGCLPCCVKRPEDAGKFFFERFRIGWSIFGRANFRPGSRGATIGVAFARARGRDATSI